MTAYMYREYTEGFDVSALATHTIYGQIKVAKR